MEPAVDHDERMNSKVLAFLAANFPGICLNLEHNGIEEVLRIEGIDSEEAANFPGSSPHQIYISSEEDWVVWDVYLNCVSTYGHGLEKLVEDLNTYKYMWASLKLPDEDDGISGYVESIHD